MSALLAEMRDALDQAGSDASEDRPKLHVDGARVDPAGDDPIHGKAARLCSVNAKTFGPIAKRLDVTHLSIVEMRGGELGEIHAPRLKVLEVSWATKLADISEIARFSKLEGLFLSDTPKVYDLSPFSKLANLRVLVFEGGMWNKNKAHSLAPLNRLAKLEAVQLLNLGVEEDGLRPLAACKQLKWLSLSNQFETSDYAYLSVHLPQTECAQFAASQSTNIGEAYGDIMVTGKRKPFLKSRDAKDQARLAKYEAEFEKLKDKFRAEIGH